jgi:Ca-activated chloride channel family protein
MRLRAACVFAIAAIPAVTAAKVPAQTPTPTFKAGVDRVTVTAVVHRRSGQPVTDLTRDDFEILDNGQPRPILEFRSEPTPATVALLVDFSGSMNFAQKIPAARSAAAVLVDGLTPGVDRVGLYTFDTQMHELQPFAAAPGEVLERLAQARPFGSTSLYDAIADTGRRLAADGSIRRAVVAITDGGENSSQLSLAEVTRIASEIDVPVYIMVVVSPLDHEAQSKTDIHVAQQALMESRLGNLSHWTGGEIFLGAETVDVTRAAQQIVNELRHQYFIGFAPDSSRPGWHPIDVRLRQKNLVVRARSGYVAQHRPDYQG